MARDPFATQGDLGSDFTGVVSKAEAQEGKFGPQVVITTKLDEPFVKNDGTLAMDFPVFVRLGAGWRAGPDGDLLVHESGDLDKVMDRRSQYGALIERAAELGCKDAMLANTPDGPYRVSAWEGLRFHWMTEGAGESYSFTDKDTGEKKSGKSKGKVMPVEFLGTSGAPVSGTVGANAPSVDVEALGLPEDTLVALTDLAKTRTYGTWVNEALRFKDDAPGLVAALSDEGLYEALKAR